MRLVLIGPVWPYRGGIAQHTGRLACALVEAGHGVTVLTFSGLYPRALFPGRSVLDPSAPPDAVPAEAVIHPLWPPSWLGAARRIRRTAPDAVVLVWWVPYFAPFVIGLSALLGPRSKRAPLVLICHNVLPHDTRGAAVRALTRAALRRGDRWLVHATPLVDVLAALVGRRARRSGAVVRAALPLHDLSGRMTTVPPVAPRPADRPPSLLFFGLVRPYKGLDVLIDAVARARGAVPTLRLVVAGEFWQPVAGYRAQAERLRVADAVTFIDGYVPNEAVADLFAAADAVVLPYRAATSSGVLTVAIEHGVPMIVTAVGGLPEVVGDGDAGLVVPPDDADALAAAIVRLCTEPLLAADLRRGAVAARGRVGWDAYVAAIEGLVADASAPGSPA